jgi:hypothetical protein
LDSKFIRKVAPEVYALVPKRCRKARMVQQALMEYSWIPDIVGVPSALAHVELWGRLRGIQLSTD